MSQNSEEVKRQYRADGRAQDSHGNLPVPLLLIRLVSLFHLRVHRYQAKRRSGLVSLCILKLTLDFRSLARQRKRGFRMRLAQTQHFPVSSAQRTAILFLMRVRACLKLWFASITLSMAALFA